MISVSPLTHARKVAGLPLIIHAHGHIKIVTEPKWVQLLPRLWQLLTLIKVHVKGIPPYGVRDPRAMLLGSVLMPAVFHLMNYIRVSNSIRV